MQDIQLAQTDDLIDELKSRYENMVIIGTKPNKTDNEKQLIDYDYRGNWLACLGLLDYMKDKILDLNMPTED